MVLVKSFEETRSEVKSAVKRINGKTQAAQAITPQETQVQVKKEQREKPVVGEPWTNPIYGEPYSNPRLDAHRVYKLPGRRKKNADMVDIVYKQKEKVYMQTAKAMISAAATIGCFIFLAGPLVLLSVLAAASTGYHILRWKQELGWLENVIMNLQYITFINVEGEYDPVTKPPYKFNWIGK